MPPTRSPTVSGASSSHFHGARLAAPWNPATTSSPCPAHRPVFSERGPYTRAAHRSAHRAEARQTERGIMPTTISERDALEFVARQPDWLIDGIGARAAFDKIEPERAKLRDLTREATATKAALKALEDDLAPFDDIQEAKRAAREADAAVTRQDRAVKAAIKAAALAVIDHDLDAKRRLAAKHALEFDDALRPAWDEVKRLLRARKSATDVLRILPVRVPISPTYRDRAFEVNEVAVVELDRNTAREIVDGADLPDLAPSHGIVGAELHFTSDGSGPRVSERKATAITRVRGVRPDSTVTALPGTSLRGIR